MERINVTLDKKTLFMMEGICSTYALNRSELIRTMVDILNELNAWSVLEDVAIDQAKGSDQVEGWQLVEAAKSCTVRRCD